MNIYRDASCRPLISGEFLPLGSRRTLPITNPGNGEVSGSLVCASVDDVSAAVAAAKSAFHSWKVSPPDERGQILLRAAAILKESVDESAEVLTLEQGKTLSESRTEWIRAIETFEWHGTESARLTSPVSLSGKGGERMIMPEPIGVAAIFTPWNYPAVIIARKLSAALVAGCAVVLKAAEETPNTAIIIAKALFEAGLPPNVLHVLFGDPEEISSVLLASRAVRVMSFTGSTRVGKHLGRSAGEALIRHVLELGGHSPVIVAADVNVAEVAAEIVEYKSDCAGQSCNAPSRAFVHRDVYQSFVEAFSYISERRIVGEGWRPDVEMGPMASRNRVLEMEDLVADAEARGGRTVCGGRALQRPGYFFPPTVLVDVPQDARIFVDEPFGPILPISPIDSVEHGLERANNNPYGLASYIFTQDPIAALRAASQFEAGSVGINQLRGVPPDAPVSGTKDSGYGYEGGTPGVEAFQNRKLVSGMPRRTDTTRTAQEIISVGAGVTAQS